MKTESMAAPAGATGPRFVTEEPTYVTGVCSSTSVQPSHSCADPAQARLPVKRCLFASASSVGSHTGTQLVRAPILVRSDAPRYSRRRMTKFRNTYGAEPVVFLKVGDRNVFDYSISVGARGEVMASELCDVAREPVLVRSTRTLISVGHFHDAELDKNRAPAPSSMLTSRADGELTQGAEAADADSAGCGAIDTSTDGSLKIATVHSLMDAGSPIAALDGCENQGNKAQIKRLIPPTRRDERAPRPACGGDGCRKRRCSTFSEQQEVLAGPDGDSCGNLLWLLDFRLDDLLKPTADDQPGAHAGHHTPANQSLAGSPPQQCRPHKRRRPPSRCELWYGGQGATGTTCTGYQPSPRDPSHLQDGCGGAAPGTTRKPALTYTELIGMALADSGGSMTVADIYRWITDHFAFYKATDERWKNSIRHNLSLSRRFEKCGKPCPGGGHLWRLTAGPAPASGGPRAGNAAAKQPVLGIDLADGDDTSQPTNDIWLSSAAAADHGRDQLPPIGGALQLFHCAPDETVPGVPTAFSLEEAADRILSGSNHQVEVQFISSRVDADPLPPEPPLDAYRALDAA